MEEGDQVRFRGGYPLVAEPASQIEEKSAMNDSVGTGFIRTINDGHWIVGNNSFEMTVSLNDDGLPVISRLIDTALPDLDWAVEAYLDQ